MERKLCAGCGHPNMLTETSCWACGGTHFVAETNPPDIQNRTLSLPHFRERTLAWEAERRPVAVYWLAGAMSFAFFACFLGYWIGRASAPAQPPVSTPQQVAVTAQPATPLPNLQPTPLTVNPSPQFSSAAPAGTPPAAVSIRPVPARPGSPAGPQVATNLPPYPSRLVAPAAVATVQTQGPQRPIAPRRAPAVTTDRSVPEAPPEMDIPAPAPSSGSGVVTLRNDTQGAVSITLDGNGTRTATIAPGTAYPLSLSPGTYHLRATSAGAWSPSSTLAIAPNRTYSLLISKTGRDSLSLIEPAIEGG